METTVNKVEIKGFLGKDAVVKTFNGKSLINMSVATNESYKNYKGEWIKNTTWHKISYWVGKVESYTEQLKKGIMVQVTGKLNTRKYTDKNGNDKYITEIIAQNIEKVKPAN